MAQRQLLYRRQPPFAYLRPVTGIGDPLVAEPTHRACPPTLSGAASPIGGAGSAPEGRGWPHPAPYEHTGRKRRRDGSPRARPLIPTGQGVAAPPPPHKAGALRLVRRPSPIFKFCWRRFLRGWVVARTRGRLPSRTTAVACSVPWYKCWGASFSSKDERSLSGVDLGHIVDFGGTSGCSTVPAGWLAPRTPALAPVVQLRTGRPLGLLL